MKSFTDLEQSNKLAEILPLESADMHYERVYFEGKQSDWFVKLGRPIKSDDIIPCWSLAALLDILPLEIETHKQTEGNRIYYYVESYMKHMEKETYLSTERHKNLVDACVEMILKLHELNLI